ncbi:formimidoylglutamase [Gallaecimonas pentaromativorans]|uniref:formimidoylglutamase n=1 Tax=Gallaecimonas pentaromativorans TaxID=584787 RepID=UPI003A91F71D
MKRRKSPMAMKVYTHSDIAALIHHRPLETKVGEALTLLPKGASLAERLHGARALGGRYALLGVPEDLGPRANLGQGGADKGWPAFLARFLNLQSQDGFRCSSMVLVGELELNDLAAASDGLSSQHPEQLAQLRELVAEVDNRLAPVISQVVEAGLTPIVIGGGHNNAYPVIKGVSHALASPLGVLNIDPHADFRPAEGRHSGNGFRYAYEEGLLAQYQVMAMHPWKNSAASQQAMADAGFGHASYLDLYVKRSLSLEKALAEMAARLEHYPCGLEVDLDVINHLPASAYTNASQPLCDVEYLVYQAANRLKPRYLHLCEAAPARHPAGEKAGMSDCGQALAALVVAFVSAMEALD